MSFSITAAIGFIIPPRVAMLDGLMRIEHIDALRDDERLPLDDAVRKGTRARPRPVLSTLDRLRAGGDHKWGGGRGAAPAPTIVIGAIVTSPRLAPLLPSLYRAVVGAIRPAQKEPDA